LAVPRPDCKTVLNRWYSRLIPCEKLDCQAGMSNCNNMSLDVLWAEVVMLWQSSTRTPSCSAFQPGRQLPSGLHWKTGQANTDGRKRKESRTTRHSNAAIF
jgi:hypothetical protein